MHYRKPEQVQENWRSKVSFIKQIRKRKPEHYQWNWLFVIEHWKTYFGTQLVTISQLKSVLCSYCHKHSRSYKIATLKTDCMISDSAPLAKNWNHKPMNGENVIPFLSVINFSVKPNLCQMNKGFRAYCIEILSLFTLLRSLCSNPFIPTAPIILNHIIAAPKSGSTVALVSICIMRRKCHWSSETVSASIMFCKTCRVFPRHTLKCRMRLLELHACPHTCKNMPHSGNIEFS